MNQDTRDNKKIKLERCNVSEGYSDVVTSSIGGRMNQNESRSHDSQVRNLPGSHIGDK
jgi:hypothetical protein